LSDSNGLRRHFRADAPIGDRPSACRLSVTLRPRARGGSLDVQERLDPQQALAGLDGLSFEQ
jgi:hypothetical protein